LNEIKSNDRKTSFDETICELKEDPNALSNHIVNLLEIQINGHLKEEIQYYRKVQALYPIISILFNDKTKVEIFVQIKINKEYSDQNKSENDSILEDSIHGVRKTIDHCKTIRRLFIFTNGS